MRRDRIFTRRFWREARRDVIERPVVSPFTALLLVSFVVGIGILSARVAPGAVDPCAPNPALPPVESPSISTNTGFIVLGVTAFLLLATGWAPILYREIRGLSAISLAFGVILKPLSVVLSALDWFMVRVVAWVCGASLPTIWGRYGVLALNMGPAIAAVWWANEDWPLLGHGWGVLGAVWGVVASLAIARRWLWIENDRETFLNSGDEMKKVYRIGFGQDLRDEALTAFVLLYILAPLGLRQIDLATPGGWFFEENHFAPDPLKWIGFFGAELAKAVPFVDWAEVYGFKNGSTALCPRTPEAAHAVFALRAGMDLVLLASLLQAVQISARISSQRAAFFKEGSINKLDPFEERQAFVAFCNRLEGNLPSYAAVGSFPAYDSSRLRRIVRDPANHVRERIGAMSVGFMQDTWFPPSVLSRIALSKDADDDLRASAAEMIGFCRQIDLQSTLITLAGSTSHPNLLNACLRSLAIIGDARAAQPLLDGLGNRNWSIRYQAALALALIYRRMMPQDSRRDQIPTRLRNALAEETNPICRTAIEACIESVAGAGWEAAKRLVRTTTQLSTPDVLLLDASGCPIGDPIWDELRASRLVEVIRPLEWMGRLAPPADATPRDDADEPA